MKAMESKIPFPPIKGQLEPNPSAASGRGSSPPKRALAFLAFQALLAAVFFSDLRAWVQLSGQAVHFSHIILIPLVSAFLLFVRRNEVFSPQTRPSFLAAAVLMASGLIVYRFAQASAERLMHSDYLTLATIAILLLWAGGLALTYGAAVLRKGLFPVLFLIFAIPIPGPLLDWIVSFLQKGSAEVAYSLFRISPTPVLRDGFAFMLPGLEIEVAPECSGIRSGLALLITAVLAGNLFLQKTASRILVVLVAVPIIIFKNGLRVVTLSLLSIYVDPSFIDGSLHTRGGYPFFALSLLLLVPFLWLARRREASLIDAEKGPGKV